MKTKAFRVEDQGDPWVTRLAMALKLFDQMEPPEKMATLNFLISRYSLPKACNQCGADLSASS